MELLLSIFIVNSFLINSLFILNINLIDIIDWIISLSYLALVFANEFLKIFFLFDFSKILNYFTSFSRKLFHQFIIYNFQKKNIDAILLFLSLENYRSLSANDIRNATKTAQHMIQASVKERSTRGNWSVRIRFFRKISFIQVYPGCFEGSNTPKKSRQFWKSTFSNVTSFTTYPRGEDLFNGGLKSNLQGGTRFEPAGWEIRSPREISSRPFLDYASDMVATAKLKPTPVHSLTMERALIGRRKKSLAEINTICTDVC